MRVYKFIVFLGISAIAVSYLILYLARLDQYQETHSKRTESIARIGMIAGCIFTIGKDTGQHPVTKERVIDWISINQKEKYIKIDNHSQNILDEWGMPIAFVYEKHAIYKLISYGPNGKNDHGKGDDIVRVFNLGGDQLELVK